MIDTTVHVRASLAAVMYAIGQLPALAAAGGSAADAMMRRCGLAALGRIKKAFVDKSRGGVDEAGDSWKPLDPRTIAYSRRHRKLHGDPRGSQLFSRAKNKPWVPKSSKRAAYPPSYALTNKQGSRWWQVYRQQLAIYKGNKAHAAAVAWIVVKREGATTIIDQYGSARVDILRDTGLLLNSLSPGTSSTDQVFRIGRGEVIIGTNRKHAGGHHRGVPGRLPQRQLWPDPSRWPPSWWSDMLEQLQQGVVDIVVQALKRL